MAGDDKSEGPEKTLLEPLNEALVEKLVANHIAFKKFLTKRLPSEEVAEEILQQGLAKAFESGGALKNDESIVAWFYRILKNVLIDYYRARASESDKNAAYLRELTAQGQSVVPSMDEVEAAVCACMVRLLPTLKPAYGEVLKRVDLGGESLENVARDLGTNVGNLTVRLHRARQAFKITIERSCGACTEHGCLDCDCE
jgi:RNA polymerase sigma-70 factor (ECF subfamily)